MVYLISKPTRREAEASRREGLAKARLSPKRYRGTASCAEEAHDTQRALERDGETFDKLWQVSEDSKEAKQAEEDLMLRTGIDPETMEKIG
ncbi:hypothetical protein LCGC14_1935720 [marine sediment metagenome]|uniref:Uncharacterized protein n=1 Tax=marine sediment metagenome TaxID=412755 RepID=A0A0F9I0B9_9ZZZZ